MLKVIIADDEARVCRLVQMLVDWEELGMEVAGTASNGLEALELVETLKPDILFTDMRMPGCDGLELIERAKRVSPHLEIVLISGYAQFEYAQTAMRYDVGDYLLKPIKKDVLTATLKKLGNRCRERAASSAALEALRRDSSKSRALLLNRLLEDLLRGRLDAPSREQLQSEYGFPVRDGTLQALILKMDYNPENFRGASVDVIREKTEEIFETVVSPLCSFRVFQFIGAAGYGILNYPPQRSDQVRRALRQCLNQLDARKFIFGPVEFSMAAGRAVDAPEKLPFSMRGAQDAITERIVEGTGRLLEAVPAVSRINSDKMLDQYNRAMDHIVDTLNAQAADQAADQLRDEAGRISGIHGYELLDLVLAAGKLFSIRLNMREETGPARAFEEHCGLCGSADQLFGCLRDFQRRQLSAVCERRESEAIRPIRIAKQYIHEHFNQPITLEDVCAATGFSVSYFSMMFKRETGEGFSKYLTRVRVERAKALLMDRALSVADICERVGYSDLKHFTNTFKKMTSLNPGQYRRLYG